MVGDTLRGGCADNLIVGGNLHESVRELDIDFEFGWPDSVAYQTFKFGRADLGRLFSQSAVHMSTIVCSNIGNETAGHDTITGGTRRNVIIGGSGKDIIDLSASDRSTASAEGFDVVFGDVLQLSYDDNWVLESRALVETTRPYGHIVDVGWGDQDKIRGGRLPSVVYGQCGNDIFLGYGYEDVLEGDGSISMDIVYGGQGNDYLNGGDGVDFLFGENDSDTLIGGVGIDTMKGEPRQQTWWESVWESHEDHFYFGPYQLESNLPETVKSDFIVGADVNLDKVPEIPDFNNNLRSDSSLVSQPHDEPVTLAYGPAIDLINREAARELNVSGKWNYLLGSSAYSIVIADLPGLLLGQASRNTITLDIDAAGYGWFIDTTPWEDSEFDPQYAANHDGELSPAEGRVDLLTVVMHEMGHLLGMEHAEDEDDFMHETLPIGTRRTMTSQLADAVFAEEDEDEDDTGTELDADLVRLLADRKW